MPSGLVRIRFQETWGEQDSGYLPDIFTSSEAVGVIFGVAGDWFPTGHEVVQDPDSPAAWVVTDSAEPSRRLYLFVEQVGA